MTAGGFLKVPDALLYDPTVSDGVLRAYMAMARYAITCSCDTFELTADALGTLLGRGRDQAERRVRELVKLGLLEVESYGGHGHRPNRYTVLDPQGVVFAGLHVARGAAEVRRTGAAEVRHRGAAKMRTSYIEGREEREGQRTKRSASAPTSPLPVDNGGAPRTPIPRRPRCAIHEPPGAWSETTECRGCVADAKAAGYSREPAF